MAAQPLSRRARDHARWSPLVSPPDAYSEPSTPTPCREQRQQRRRQLSQRLNLSDARPESLSGTSRTTAIAGAGSASTSALGPNYSAREETLRNDYSQRYVDTGAGELPANAVRNPGAATRFDEYPKLKRLVELKDALVTRVAHPPTYLRADLRLSLPPFRDPLRPAHHFHLASLIPVKYDVVLIDPPLEAYAWEGLPAGSSHPHHAWSWHEIAALPIPQLAAKESFVFLWVGSGAGDGLERGREVLAKWGYRRCEDIVCIRTNPLTESGGGEVQPSTSSALARSAQHCLMGIRGTVRRSTDVRFVHCNIDTDVILWPDDGRRKGGLPDLVSKPTELYQLIENFCLGTRRLELFGRNRNLRRGWLTVGLEVGPEAMDFPPNGYIALPTAGLSVLEEDGMQEARLEVLRYARAYDKQQYDAGFGVDRPGCDLRDRSNLVPFDPQVDGLRPKSPTPRPRPATTRPTSVLGMPSGLSHNPALRTHQPYPHLQPFAHDATSIRPPGAGLSGLGAGGPRTVSIPSGSDTLSGPQASVLKSKSAAYKPTPPLKPSSP